MLNSHANILIFSFLACWGAVRHSVS